MNDLYEGILSEFAEASSLGQTTWLDMFEQEAGCMDMHVTRRRASIGAKSPEATKVWKKLNASCVAEHQRVWQQQNRDKVNAYSRAYRARQRLKAA